MSGRIPAEFIDDLIARTDILSLIGARLTLRRAGRDHRALCPFHQEKTPSFTVSPDKQFYHCFGCGAHGTAIGFLIAHDRLTFREAVEELAARAGLELPSGAAPVQSGPDLAPLRALHEQVAALYRRQLREHPQSARAIAYLRQRGLDDAIIDRYGLGFAPPGWDFLLARLGTRAADRALLAQCGLIAEQEGRVYDRFRDRIIFPIRDRRGRTIAFGGRLLDDGTPKYLNSPETPLFHKGRELYGLHELQQSERSPGAVLAVEGYLDVIALAQAGIPSALATLGTATTADHLRILTRLAPRLIFCFDGDPAGRAAAWKALETALPLATGQQSIGFLWLPEGEDPDTLVRRDGAAALRARLEQAQPLSDLLFARLAEGLNLHVHDDRAQFVTRMQPLLERIPAGIYRDMLYARLAETARLPIGSPALESPRAAGRRPVRTRQPGRPSRIALAIALLLDRPALAAAAADLDPAWRRFPGPGTEVLSELLAILAARPELPTAALLERWRDHPYFGYLQRLSVEPFIQAIPEPGRADEFRGALERMSAEVCRMELGRPLERLSTAEWDAGERARLEELAVLARNRRR